MPKNGNMPKDEENSGLDVAQPGGEPAPEEPTAEQWREMVAAKDAQIEQQGEMLQQQSARIDSLISQFAKLATMPQPGENLGQNNQQEDEKRLLELDFSI